MGVAGSFNVRDLCQYRMSLPECDVSPDRWMRTEFIPSLRKAADDAGIDLDECGDDGEYTNDFELVVGLSGRIYYVSTDCAVLEPVKHKGGLAFVTVGTGGDWATGALYALRNSELTLRQLAEEALEASAENCSAVRAPWRIMEAT